jgi:hypothetical protein
MLFGPPLSQVDPPRPEPVSCSSNISLILPSTSTRSNIFWHRGPCYSLPQGSFLGMELSVPLPISGLIQSLKFLKVEPPFVQNLPFLEPLNFCNFSTSLSSSPPPLASYSMILPSPPDSTSLPSSNDSSSAISQDSNIFFRLWNKNIISSMSSSSGLRLNPEVHLTKKGQGKISHLSKAQSRALFDIDFGKKHSTFWALRAAHSPKEIPP